MAVRCITARNGQMALGNRVDIVTGKHRLRYRTLIVGYSPANIVRRGGRAIVDSVNLWETGKSYLDIPDEFFPQVPYSNEGLLLHNPAVDVQDHAGSQDFVTELAYNFAYNLRPGDMLTCAVQKFNLPPRRRKVSHVWLTQKMGVFDVAVSFANALPTHAFKTRDMQFLGYEQR